MIKYSDSAMADFVTLIVCASHIDGENPAKTLGMLSDLLSETFDDHEIIVIADNPLKFNRRLVEDILNIVCSIRYIESASEMSESDAFELGLRLSIGDFILYIRPDEDDSRIIDQVVKLARKSGQIVVGVERNPNETLLYKLSRPLFSLIEGFVGYNLPRRVTALRCFSRSQVNAYSRIINSPDQIFLKVDQIASGYSVFEYETKSQARKQFLPKLIEAASLFINNSTKPLRFASLLGAFGSFAAFVFACYSFLSHFFTNDVVSGWSSLVIIVSFLFFILFTILVLIGEYLAQIIRDIRARDRVSGLKEFHSKIMLSENRINVIDIKSIGSED